jgi:glutamyl-tRNA reductase
MRFFASKCAEITLLNTDQDNERTLMRQDGFHSCLILSAPLSHEQTLQLIDKWGSKVQILFDLRGMESHKEENVFKSLVKNQFPGIEVIFLHELFQVLTYHREKIQSQIEEVKFLIRGKVDEFAHRLEHRPLGWDDLCA